MLVQTPAQELRLVLITLQTLRRIITIMVLLDRRASPGMYPLLHAAVGSSASASGAVLARGCNCLAPHSLLAFCTVVEEKYIFAH